MNLIIVDNNINYANKLKEVLVENIIVESINVVRKINLILSDNIQTQSVILFEPTKENLLEIKSYLSGNINSNIRFIALSNETESQELIESVANGVSSIIYKSEKLEFIIEELKLVLRGKVVFPQKIINRIKDSFSAQVIKKPNSQLKKMFGKYLSI